MNKQRRKELEKARKALQNIESDLERLIYEEQDYYDNMPANLQGGMRGMDSEMALSDMEDAQAEVQNAIDSIKEAVKCLTGI